MLFFFQMYPRRTSNAVFKCAVLMALVVSSTLAIFTTQPPLHGFNTTQFASVARLDGARSHSSVVPFNETLVIVGGCMELACNHSAQFSSAVSTFNPETNNFAATIPSLESGIAGFYSTVAKADSLYVVRACSVLPLRQNVTRGVIELFRRVELLDAANDALRWNRSFMVLPENYTKCNASCILFNSRIYIVGGIFLPSMKMSDTVDVIDLSSYTYKFNVTQLPVPLHSPSIAKDSVGIYVVGGVLLHGALSRGITVIYPQKAGSAPCMQLLVPLPDAFYFVAARDTPDLHATLYGGYLVIVASSRVSFASLNLVRSSWELFDLRIPKADPPNIARLSSWCAVPFATASEGARMHFYLFGGIATNASNHVSFLTDVVAVSASSIRIPAPIFASPEVVVGRPFRFPLHGGSAESRVACVGDNSPCEVRLSQSIDCSTGQAGGTGDTKWGGSGDISFLPDGVAYPVYVCFTNGIVAKCKAPNGAVLSQTVFSVTDPFHPLEIVPGSSHPTGSTSPPDPDDHKSLLFIIGCIAAVTVIIAVILIIRAKQTAMAADPPTLSRLLPATPVASSIFPAVAADRYATIGKIGKGAFSTVYLVARRTDGQKFALKHMECQSDAARQDAIKECEIMRTLQGHPNIIMLVDMFMNYEFEPAFPAATTTLGSATSGERSHNSPVDQEPPKKPSRHLCLVMEYHEGGDLKKWVLSLTSSAVETVVCSIAFQICSVLKHIHAQHPPVIHRDLKPENILICNAPLKKSAFLPIIVTDFGLARIQDEEYCKSGAGTLPYVAPECFKNHYTTQADMWSMGCVMYAVATRRLQDGKVRVMFRDCEEPGFHASIREDILQCGYSPALAQFIVMLLEPEPENRPSAVGAFKWFRKKGHQIYISSRICSSVSARGVASPTAKGSKEALSRAMPAKPKSPPPEALRNEDRRKSITHEDPPQDLSMQAIIPPAKDARIDE